MLWDVLLWKLLYQGKLFRYFIFSAVDLIFGMGFVSFFNKKLGFFCLQSQRKEPSSMKCFHYYFYVRLDLFPSLPCRYLQRTLLFLCPVQLHGFEVNCFHWTQISFLSLRIRPSISWVGPGYNYTESSSSHQCVRILSCHLICSNYFFNLLQLFFICSNNFLFPATFLFAACPLWTTVSNRGKRKSFSGKLHLWWNPVRKHLQKHKP